MKKLICFLMVFIVIVSLFACEKAIATKDVDRSLSVSYGNVGSASSPSGSASSPSGSASSQSGSASSQSGSADTGTSVGTPEQAGTVRLNASTDKVFSDEGFLNAAYLNAYNDFSCSFIKNVAKDGAGKNYCVSPLSVYACYSLCFAGAGGNTLKEFEKVFGLSRADAKKFCEGVYARFMQRKYSDKNTKVNLANSVWIDDDHAVFVKDNYLAQATESFNAPIFKSDFKASETVDNINAWVNDNTDGLIKKLLDELGDDSFMALINALLIEANWEEKYENTVSDIFRCANGSETTVEYLPGVTYGYYSSDEAVAFRAYLKDGFSFIGILPDENIGADEYVKSLTADKISGLLSTKISGRRVYTRIPKFNFDYDLDLKELMLSIGLTDAFDPVRADFKAMAEIPDANVYVGSSVHKTHFELDENGIKAAAVTSIITDKATSVYDDKPIEIYLDRPFVFMLVENETSAPLFIGTVNTL